MTEAQCSPPISPAAIWDYVTCFRAPRWCYRLMSTGITFSPARRSQSAIERRRILLQISLSPAEKLIVRLGQHHLMFTCRSSASKFLRANASRSTMTFGASIARKSFGTHAKDYSLTGSTDFFGRCCQGDISTRFDHRFTLKSVEPVSE